MFHIFLTDEIVSGEPWVLMDFDPNGVHLNKPQDTPKLLSFFKLSWLARYGRPRIYVYMYNDNLGAEKPHSISLIRSFLFGNIFREYELEFLSEYRSIWESCKSHLLVTKSRLNFAHCFFGGKGVVLFVLKVVN